MQTDRRSDRGARGLVADRAGATELVDAADYAGAAELADAATAAEAAAAPGIASAPDAADGTTSDIADTAANPAANDADGTATADATADPAANCTATDAAGRAAADPAANAADTVADPAATAATTADPAATTAADGTSTATGPTAADGTATSPTADADLTAAQEVTASLLAASRLIVALSVRALTDVDETLTLPQLRTLVVLADRAPLKLSDLAAELGVNPSTAVRMADRLAAAGLLARQPNPDSRREQLVTLTPVGRDLVRTVMDRRHAEIAALVRHLPAPDRAGLVRALRSLTAAARDTYPDSPDHPGLRLG